MAFGQGLAPHQGTALHKGKNLKLIAIVGVGALAVFLLIRSRSSSSSATTTPTQDPNVDPTTGLTYAQEAADSSAGTPSTFADNGASAAGLSDAVTSGLSGVGASLDQLTQADQALAAQLQAGSVPTTAAPADASSPQDTGSASPLNITINTGQKPNSGGHNNRGSKTGQNNTRGTGGSKGGSSKSGSGHGKTTQTGGGHKGNQVANHGGGQKQHGGTKKHGHTKH